MSCPSLKAIRTVEILEANEARYGLMKRRKDVSPQTGRIPALLDILYGHFGVSDRTQVAAILALVAAVDKYPKAPKPAFSKAERQSHGFWCDKIRRKYDGDPKTDPMSGGEFLAEDVFACEQQQVAFSSPHFSVGTSVDDGEKTVRDYQGIIERWMKAALSPGLQPQLLCPQRGQPMLQP